MTHHAYPNLPGRTWVEVDLGAIRHNVRALKRRAPSSLLMAVVKADAYGHGAVPVARAALDAGAEKLAVVTAEEGAELREAGIEAPILVFTDLLPDGLDLAERSRLTVTAHSPESAKRIAARPGLAAHLKVNTGMNRWGVEPEGVGEARKILGGQLAGVYTHFAAADSDAGATRRQTKAFDAVLSAHAFGGALVHAANSAATLWHPSSHYGCVRPGVAVYGMHPGGDAGDPAEEGLRPALSLKSYVAAVRDVAPGEGVSYGLTWRAEKTTRAATVPVGYAEGYRRALSNGAFALIGGERRPLLGRVTMDACVFGADEGVGVGDEVVLVGGQGAGSFGPREVARWAGTINYEVTTGINPGAWRGATEVFKDIDWGGAVRRAALTVLIYLGLIYVLNVALPGSASGIVPTAINAAILFVIFTFFHGFVERRKKRQKAALRSQEGNKKPKKGPVAASGADGENGDGVTLAKDFKGRQNPNTSRKKASRRRR